MKVNAVQDAGSMNFILLVQGFLPAIADAETEVGFPDRSILALLQVRATVVFDVVHSADKVGNLLALFQNGQGVGSQAVLSVVVIVGQGGASEVIDQFLNSLG